MNRFQNGSRLKMGFIFLVCLLLLAACSSANKQTVPEEQPVVQQEPPEEEPAAQEPAVPEPAEPAFQAAFTGAAEKEDITERPLAVMINNFKAARPQSGLTHADVLWEVLAEGGITRLVAVFQSETFTDPIGPIRSIRPYLIELGGLYQAVTVHAGASNDGYAILQHEHKQDLDEITNAGSYFWRDKSRKAPHNLYSDLAKLRQGAEKKGYDAVVSIPSFTFMDAPASPAGTDAANITIHFMLKDYKVSYQYDAAKQLYMRSINDRPHTDLNNGKQLSASNLVVLGASHKVLDDYGRLSIDLDSGGPALLFQLGKAVDCQWEKDAGGMIRIKKDGRELPFITGKTFYHIVPLKPSFAEHVVYG